MQEKKYKTLDLKASLIKFSNQPQLQEKKSFSWNLFSNRSKNKINHEISQKLYNKKKEDRQQQKAHSKYIGGRS